MTLAAAPDEVLADGWAPTTPPGDNLVLDFARTQAAAYRALTEAGGGRSIEDQDLGVALADLGSPSPFGNTAVVLRPVPAGDQAGLVAQIRTWFAEHPGGPFLLFSSPTLTDLAPAMLARVGHPPLMLRAGGPPPPPLPEGLEVRPVVDEDGLRDFERTAIEGYPVPELQPWTPGSYLRRPVLDTDWRFVVGYVDGEPVATAAAYLGPTLTLVELVAVREAHRGRGYGAAVTAAASAAGGAGPAMLIASDLGRPTYDALGFLPILRQTLWIGVR